jgi:hypothetical protein
LFTLDQASSRHAEADAMPAMLMMPPAYAATPPLFLLPLLRPRHAMLLRDAPMMPLPPTLILCF